MGRIRLLPVFPTIFIIMAFCACGEKTNSPEDLQYKNVIGEWRAIKKSEENGVKIEESLATQFWRQQDETRYRWTYRITYDGIEEESKGHQEDGTCTVTETEITFIPDSGETRTLSYALLTDNPLYDMRIIDKNGVEWNFTYFAQFGHIP